jgi:hypothetical protein
MQTEFEEPKAGPSITKRIFAGVVLVIAVALAFKLLIGFVMAIFWTIVAIAVVVAILWALKTLVW